MLSYKEMDNLAAVEIEISARVSTEEFDKTARKLEAFIARHGRVRVLEIVHDFEGMDAKAFWHDLKFSLRHLNDFSRCAIVSDAKFLSLWSADRRAVHRLRGLVFSPRRGRSRARLAVVARRRRRRRLNSLKSWGRKDSLHLRSFP